MIKASKRSFFQSKAAQVNVTMKKPSKKQFVQNVYKLCHTMLNVTVMGACFPPAPQNISTFTLDYFPYCSRDVIGSFKSSFFYCKFCPSLDDEAEPFLH